jgi:single-stranded DNA-specific DHH superfamily exonuclease
MDRVDFVYGNEKRFYDFISRLDDKGKIALVSHTDLDGIASARVVNEVVNADILKFVNYDDLNLGLVKELRESKAKRIIFTDLMIRDSEFVSGLEKFADVLVIDHHTPERDYNSDRTVFMNSQGNCGAYLSYHLFSKVQNLEKLDWLVACACLADFFYFENKEFMRKTYEKYGDKFVFDGDFVNMQGKFWDFQYDLSLGIIYYFGKTEEFYKRLPREFGKLGELEKAVAEVRNDLENAKNKFDEEKEVIGDIYFWEAKSRYGVKSLIINDLSKKILDKTLVFAKHEGDFYFVSARRQDGKRDMNQLMQDLTRGLENANGGGHFKAGGATIMFKDKEEFMRRLREVANLT